MKTQSSIQQRTSRGSTPRGGFTLVELLAVMVVILVLAGILIGVNAYVQRRMQLMTTKSQLNALATALEAYKSDWGYYPRTFAPRISNMGDAEARNNWLLYRALTGVGGRTYLRSMAGFQARLNTVLGTNFITGYTTNNVLFSGTNWFDPFGKPYNYYNSPQTAYGLSNNVYSVSWGPGSGYSVGGQVNPTSYDLFSYGPDRLTYVPGASTNWYLIPTSSTIVYVGQPFVANDDIWSNQR